MKPWHLSKTIWFNIGSFLVTIGTEFAFMVDFAADEYQAGARLAVSTIVAVGNVILRTVTTEAIE